MVDVVTHEMDHNPNNYRVKLRNGRAVGLSLFDNNGGGTFCRKTNISFRTYKGYGPLFDIKAQLTVPYLDRELLDRFRALSLFRLLRSLRPLIGVSRKFFVYLRIKSLLRCCRKVSPERILGPTEWSEQTVHEELNWGNLHSYLFNYLEDCCVPDGAEAEKQLARSGI